MQGPDQEITLDLKVIRRAVLLLAIIAGFGVTYFARDLILPIVLGFLLALTLSPINRVCIRRGLPAGVSAGFLILLATAVIFYVVYLVGEAARSWPTEAPRMLQQIEFKFRDVKETVDAVNEASDKVQQIGASAQGDQPQAVVTEQPNLLNSALTTAASTFVTTMTALLLAFFLLATGDLFYSKLVQSFPTFHQKKKALAAVHGIERVVSRYLLTITVINACLGLAIGTAMWLIGLEYAAYWGLAAFLLNYLPILGGVIGTLLVGVYAIIQFDTLSYALLAPLAYQVLTASEGQLLTPYLLGRRLELNVVAVFLTVVIWAWLWGIPGALVAVPVLIVFKEVCANVAGLAFIDNFLGSDSRKETRNAQN